ncbi:uncharacterized protein LOC126717659 [Quercus robur]|uniref:uncharacterized protein LOC126717659 n=1 Tax=Quercus robur TaxID=38942 RepID=UPI002162AC3C|nr:uncharacterized protein LOC126717659 [Quercus robur]
MGLHSKRSKKAQDIDSDFEDFDEDMENGNLTLGHEEEEEEANYEGEDGEGDEGEANNGDEEMEQLEEEYQNLKHQEIDIFNDLKRHKDEDLLKGQAVKNQKALWDKALELRLLVQKAFSSANRLPQEPIRSSFCNSDEGVNTAYSDLITSSKNTLWPVWKFRVVRRVSGGVLIAHELRLRGPQHFHRRQLCLRKNPSIAESSDGIEQVLFVLLVKGFSIAFENISEQVADYMRDPSRMLKQMQLRRSTVSVFGTDPDRENSAKGEEVQADGDPELLDDSEFYTQLLKEFLETNDPKSSDFYALKRLQTKKRKIVDRRASKSCKIRYNVHEKIVNFMAPQTMDLPPMAPKLFENLFGLKTQKPASVV